MDYARIAALKLPIGSGAIESAIRRVVNLRLKGPSIYWHKTTAEAVLLLRSYYKAGRWNHRESNTGGGSRTHTGVSAQRILSPQRLPFRHAGSCGEVSTGRRCHKRKEPGRPGRFAIGAGPIRSRSDRSGGTPIHDPARTSPPLPRHSSPATNLLGKSKACNRSTWAVRARRSPTGPWSRWCRGAHRATSRLARSIWTFLFGHGGGGGGIRTHGQAEPVNGFQDRPDQPLWHPSGSSDKRQMTNGR